MITFFIGFGAALLFMVVGVYVLHLFGLLASWHKEIDRVDRNHKVLDNRIDKALDTLRTEMQKDQELMRVQMSSEFNQALRTLELQLENIDRTNQAVMRDDKGFTDDYKAQVNKHADHLPMDDYS